MREAQVHATRIQRANSKRLVVRCKKSRFASELALFNDSSYDIPIEIYTIQSDDPILLMNEFNQSKKDTHRKPTNHSTGKACRFSGDQIHGTRSRLRQNLKSNRSFQVYTIILLTLLLRGNYDITEAQSYDAAATLSSSASANGSPSPSESNPQSASTAATCFGGLQTFEKISMSSFENPTSAGSSSSSFGSGILVQQDDQALTSECVNLCRSQSNCLSFVIDYNKFECKSYATTQQELQQEFDAKYQSARSISNTTTNGTDYQASASTMHFQHLLPSTSSNYFEKICLDGVANRNQFSDVCGQGRLWTIERVVDTFLDGYVEKEVTNVNNKDECSKLCIFENQFVCRSADYEHHSRLCRLSKEDRRTQPQAMRSVPGSNRQYLENQCATPGPSSCVYETKRNVGIISMDALKFAQTVQDCQMKCNQETTFNCRSYSFHQQRCFLSGDDSSSLNSNLIKLPVKQGWSFGEKKCLVELCTKGVFSYEKITGFTLRSALSTSIDLMMGGSSISMAMVGNNLEDLEKLQHESSQTKLRHLLPMFHPVMGNGTSNIVSTMMMMAANSNPAIAMDPMHESASTLRHHRSASNLAITDHCRHSCDLGYLNCPAFTIDYKNNRCQRLDRNSQGRHHELVARDGFAYYEKICLRVPEIMSMCQDKYWIFERVIGYELAPRLYEKSLKFVQSRRDCEEYCLEEKQFQCRSALYNDETSDCKLSRLDRRLASKEGGYYRNFNVRISYLENQCIRDHSVEEKQCHYEQAKEEPAYPTFTEHIEMVPTPKATIETEMTGPSNETMTQRTGPAYCEQLCNDNTRFECHSFGYYSSTAQCFLSGDDTISAGELASTPSTGFTYFEKKCRLGQVDNTTNYSIIGGSRGGHQSSSPTTTIKPQNHNPYFGDPNGPSNPTSIVGTLDTPSITNSNNNMSSSIDQQVHYGRPKQKPAGETSTDSSSVDPNNYKCGIGHTFVYQRISGFEPIGGYLTLLVKNNEQPGIVSECSELCRRAYECRAFIVDYNSNQCYAMLENSSVGMLSLRQSLGKDYFEGFCVADHLLLTGAGCHNKTWIMDKIVDQAAIGVQHQKVIPDSDRAQCRQACLEERLFWCKSAMFDSATSECKLYSIDRESTPQMRLLFTKGVDFFENQCQIMSNLCPYDAIERDMTIITTTKSIQAKSSFDCELACNSESHFNCRSYTYLDQYPSLPNLCLLSADSRSTSQRGSTKERARTLYAERNCYYRRPRVPSGGLGQRIGGYPAEEVPPPVESTMAMDPYQSHAIDRTHIGHSSIDRYNSPSKNPEIEMGAGGVGLSPIDTITSIGHGCEPHQYTFERTFGYDYRLGQKERAPIAPAIGIAIACQQECLRRGDRCQSFVVDYALPYQSCFLIGTQVGSNKKLLIRSPNSAYFEKACYPRTGIDSEAILSGQPQASHPMDIQSMDIAPSYSSEPWTPQMPNQIPNHLQQQQLVQNYPSRTCAKLWSFERYVNHNFTAQIEKVIENSLSRAQCETLCINEAGFSCRAATYDYNTKLCRLFKNTRRTMMSQFVDLESPSSGVNASQALGNSITDSHPGTAHVLTGDDTEFVQTAATGSVNTLSEVNKRQGSARQMSLITAEPLNLENNIDYMENTCVPEPSSCQYRQVYDQFSPYIDKMNHAVSLSDCQRQCDLERLFSCKSINYDPVTKNCMLLSEDLTSLNRGHQSSLLPKKNTIYSEKGNCEMISVQCDSQEMLVSINFDSPFRGRVMAKGNPEQCFLIGDGQTILQFPIVFGPKCNSRQEGHNTFVNEVVIQQHPIIMTDNDKTVRVMCAFEAPDQTITLKSPTSRDNKTGIDVGTPEASRTRNDKQQFNSIVSNKASPPSVLLRILDQGGRDASMINLGDDLMLRIQMQTDGQNSALGIFARNLAARSSNGESLLLIDSEGCPVDPQVFPALERDPKDGKSLQSVFKAFRFPSSGLVNFEVQIRFCPERCQPVDCQRGKSKSYGRKKRELPNNVVEQGRTSILQSASDNQKAYNPLEALSTVMKPGKAFQYVRELMLATNNKPSDVTEQGGEQAVAENQQDNLANLGAPQQTSEPARELSQPSEEFDNSHAPRQDSDTVNPPDRNSYQPVSQVEPNLGTIEDSQDMKLPLQTTSQQSILNIEEKVLPSSSPVVSRGLSHSQAPYGRLPETTNEFYQTRQFVEPPPQMDPASTTEYATEETTLRPEPATADGMKMTDTPGDTPNTNQFSESIGEPVTTATTATDDARYVSPNYRDSLHTRPTMNQKDLPLRFSILVGDQALTNSWVPTNQPPVLVMNSTNMDPDHIVIPGRESNLNFRSNVNRDVSNTVDTARGPEVHQTDSSLKSTNDQNNDITASNSIAAEVKINHPSGQYTGRPTRSPQTSESAASHDCQVESGRSRLRTIIWTGSFVIALNVSLVILSLVLYFKKVHLRKNHDMTRPPSDCGGGESDCCFRWPGMLSRGKKNFGTSLNTHEHFFCKLNSQPSGSNLDTTDYNWPNFSAGSSRSTASSMAGGPSSMGSPFRAQHGRANHRLPFDAHSSLRSNFNTGHKSLMEISSYDSQMHNMHTTYTSNIDQTGMDRYRRRE